MNIFSFSWRKQNWTRLWPLPQSMEVVAVSSDYRTGLEIDTVSGSWSKHTHTNMEFQPTVSAGTWARPCFPSRFCSHLNLLKWVRGDESVSCQKCIYGFLPREGFRTTHVGRTGPRPAIYQEILQHFSLSLAEHFYGAADFIFYLVPVHKTRTMVSSNVSQTN